MSEYNNHCPHCGAPPGYGCISASGKHRQNAHAKRVRSNDNEYKDVYQSRHRLSRPATRWLARAEEEVNLSRRARNKPWSTAGELEDLIRKLDGWLSAGVPTMQYVTLADAERAAVAKVRAQVQMESDAYAAMRAKIRAREAAHHARLAAPDCSCADCTRRR